MQNKKITIVGTGLLGGSYAMALQKAGNIVYGIDNKEESINFAKENHYIDEGSVNDYEKFLQESDLIVICLYPLTFLDWIKKNVQFINPKAFITDVCGVKYKLIEEVQAILSPYNIEFYASHPMRGKEVLGIKNADCNIFKNANIILTPTEKNTKKGEEIVLDMAKTIGFTKFSFLSPKEHDEMIAYLSQLTHVLATSLMTMHSKEDEENNSENTFQENLVNYSGDSFRDLTRIAKIDEYLWTELFLWNKEILCNEIDGFVDNITKLKTAILNDDKESLYKFFRLSTKNRKLFDKEKA